MDTKKFDYEKDSIKEMLKLERWLSDHMSTYDVRNQSPVDTIIQLAENIYMYHNGKPIPTIKQERQK